MNNNIFQPGSDNKQQKNRQEQTSLHQAEVHSSECITLNQTVGSTTPEHAYNSSRNDYTSNGIGNDINTYTGIINHRALHTRTDDGESTRTAFPVINAIPTHTAGSDETLQIPSAGEERIHQTPVDDKAYQTTSIRSDETPSASSKTTVNTISAAGIGTAHAQPILADSFNLHDLDDEIRRHTTGSNSISPTSALANQRETERPTLPSPDQPSPHPQSHLHPVAQPPPSPHPPPLPADRRLSLDLPALSLCEYTCGPPAGPAEHRRWRRRHGLQRPLHVQQLLAWLLSLGSFATVVCLLLPALCLSPSHEKQADVEQNATDANISHFLTETVHRGNMSSDQNEASENKYNSRRCIHNNDEVISWALYLLTFVIYTFHVASLTGATTIDPAEPAVRLQRKRRPVPEFDRRRHSHVIEHGRCHLCNIHISSARTKHCAVCNKCVDRFDHHCRWLNQCVGRRNYLCFLVSVLSAAVWAILVAAISVVLLAQSSSEKEGKSCASLAVDGARAASMMLVPVAGVMLLLAILSTIVLSHLFGFHMYIIYHGRTTYEHIRGFDSSEITPSTTIDSQTSCCCHKEDPPDTNRTGNTGDSDAADRGNPESDPNSRRNENQATPSSINNSRSKEVDCSSSCVQCSGCRRNRQITPQTPATSPLGDTHRTLQNGWSTSHDLNGQITESGDTISATTLPISRINRLPPLIPRIGQFESSTASFSEAEPTVIGIDNHVQHTVNPNRGLDSQLGQTEISTRFQTISKPEISLAASNITSSYQPITSSQVISLHQSSSSYQLNTDTTCSLTENATSSKTRNRPIYSRDQRENNRSPNQTCSSMKLALECNNKENGLVKQCRAMDQSNEGSAFTDQSDTRSATLNLSQNCFLNEIAETISKDKDKAADNTGNKECENHIKPTMKHNETSTSQQNDSSKVFDYKNHFDSKQNQAITFYNRPHHALSQPGEPHRPSLTSRNNRGVAITTRDKHVTFRETARLRLLHIGSDSESIVSDTLSLRTSNYTV